MFKKLVDNLIEAQIDYIAYPLSQHCKKDSDKCANKIIEIGNELVVRCIWNLIEKYFFDKPQYTLFEEFNCWYKGEGNEFRFGGKLGFGGKFYRNEDKWWINCYIEDENLENRLLMNECNEYLEELFDLFLDRG